MFLRKLSIFLFIFLFTSLGSLSVYAQSDNGSFDEFTKPDPFGSRTNAPRGDVARPTKGVKPPPIPANSKIVFDATSFDFGAVPQGARITHFFKVSNLGPDTLIISSIRPG